MSLFRWLNHGTKESFDCIACKLRRYTRSQTQVRATRGLAFCRGDNPLAPLQSLGRIDFGVFTAFVAHYKVRGLYASERSFLASSTRSEYCPVAKKHAAARLHDK